MHSLFGLYSTLMLEQRDKRTFLKDIKLKPFLAFISRLLCDKSYKGLIFEG